MYLMHLDDRLRQLPGSRCHRSILRWNVTDTSPTFHLISGLYYLFQGRRIVWIEGGVTGILPECCEYRLPRTRLSGLLRRYLKSPLLEPPDRRQTSQYLSELAVRWK